MPVDFKKVVEGLGGSVSEKTVTELFFAPGRRLILEELADLTEKEAMKRILEVAFPGREEVFRREAVRTGNQ